MDEEDPRTIEQLQEANQQLHQSLKACHELVAKYRRKLAANRNDPTMPDEHAPDSGTGPL